MIKITRPQQPIWLKENYKKWGKQWESNLSNKPKQKFNWSKYQKKRVNELLMPLLTEMTQQHCAFCDAHPMGRIPNTIEHFRPTSKYPFLAYTWANLFLCCGNFQQRGDKFDKQLLKPDKDGYDFNHYFIYNYSKHIVEPNPAASIEFQKRAKLTIDLYKLNGFDRDKDRARVFKQFLNTTNANINDFPYRFIF